MTAREAIKELEDSVIYYKERVELLNIIRQELNQLEEDKQNLTEANFELCKLNHRQALFISVVKRKRVDVNYLLCCEDLEEYNGYPNIKKLTKTEFNLLKGFL